MRDFFLFDRINVDDFGGYVFRKNLYNSPKRVYSEIVVPGRNGTVKVDEGRYENLPHSYSIVFPRNADENMIALRNVLLSKTGYRRLEDSYNPDEFYLACFANSIKATTSPNASMAKFVIEFDRKPQRFLKSGEAVRTFTSSGTIVNPSQMESKPIVRIYGTGSFSINGVSVTVTTNPGYIDMDSDIEDAFMGSVNCNAYVSQDFPVLPAGENEVIIGAGITKLEIIPRWWIL